MQAIAYLVINNWQNFAFVVKPNTFSNACKSKILNLARKCVKNSLAADNIIANLHVIKIIVLIVNIVMLKFKNNQFMKLQLIIVILHKTSFNNRL